MTPEEIVNSLLAAQGELDPRSRLGALRSQLTSETLQLLVRRVQDAQQRQTGRALQMAELAQLVAAHLADPLAEALALWVRGNALYYLARYDEALDCYGRAQAIYSAQGDRMRAIGLQINRVGVLQEMGDYRAALLLAQEARAWCEALQPAAQRQLAMLEMNVGSAYQQLGELAAALAAYDRGREILVALADGIQLAMIDINRANVLEEMDHFAEADALYVSAREALAASGYTQEVARADLNRGRLAHRRGQYQAALGYLEEAHNGFAAVPNLSDVALVDLYKSSVYRDLSLYSETITLAADAYAHSEVRWNRARALINQGVGYQRLGVYAQADRLFSRARRILYQQGAHNRVLLLDVDRAQLALEQGQPTRARRLALRVEGRLADSYWPSLTARIHLLIAGCFLRQAQPRLDLALARTQHALEIATQHQLAELRVAARHLLGQILEAQADVQGACSHYLTAIQLAEELRSRLPIDEFQMGFMEQKLPIYADVVRLSRRISTPAQLFQALNLAASAPLLHLRPGGEEQVAMTPEDRQLQEDLQQLREEWYWHQAKLEHPFAAAADSELPHRDHLGSPESQDTTRRHLQALEARISELNRRWRVRASTNRAPASRTAEGELQELTPQGAARFLARIQATLSGQDLLLHYYLVDGVLQAAVVTQAGIDLVSDLAPATAVQRLLKSWRFHLEHLHLTADPDGGLQAARTHLARMYQALVAPLQGSLAGAQRLFLVLPPGWHDLPFAACYDGTHYLIDRLLVTHLSAPDVLCQPTLSQPPAPDGKPLPALVVGYSDGGRLPQARAEARQIAQILEPHMPVCSLVEEAATLTDFRIAGRVSRLVHLATHATFRPDNPLFSWIRLADARLTVADLYAMSLPKGPLVVLSACETGRGQPRGGGLLGMGRAFLAAGASGLIMSLWKVADHSSASLMADFYSRLAAADCADPAAALHAAQRHAAHSYTHPFHWASFIHLRG